MPRVVTITDKPNLSAATSRIHTSAGAAMIAVQLAPNRSIAKPVAVLHLRYRHRKSGMPRDVTITDERNFSTATSRIHTSAGAATIAVQLAPKSGIAKALQARTTGRIRRHETASFKYPSIRCYRSRYQVTPHRTSCPSLVSFSVGHYDVLVSTPDSMFSVV